MRLFIVAALASGDASSASKELDAESFLASSMQKALDLLMVNATADEMPLLKNSSESIRQFKEGLKREPAVPVSAFADPMPADARVRMQRAKAKLEYQMKSLQKMQVELQKRALASLLVARAKEEKPDLSKVRAAREKVVNALTRYSEAQEKFKAIDAKAKEMMSRVDADVMLQPRERAELKALLSKPLGKKREDATTKEVMTDLKQASSMESSLRMQAFVEETAQLRAAVASAGSMTLGGEKAQSSSPIPKVIWSPAGVNKAAEGSWTKGNPDFKLMEMSDSEMDKFMSVETDQKTYRAFRTVPLASMKRDLWRYAVMYRIGGVYAGASLPVEPVRDWFKPSSWMQGMGCKVVLGLASPKTGYVQHRVFAAAGGQLLFKQALDLAVQRIFQDKGVDEKKRGRHFADYYTGAGVFTDALKITTGVREGLCRTDPDGQLDDGSGGRVLNSCLYNNAVTELRRQNLCLEDEAFYSKDAARGLEPEAVPAGPLAMRPLWDGTESWDSLPKASPQAVKPAAPSSDVSDMLAFMSDTD